MSLTSYQFALFFCSCFVVSWSLVSQNHLRKLVLLACSYLFITLFDWRLAALLFAATSFNFLLGIVLGESLSHLSKKFYALLAISGNILLFLVFNYFGFFLEALTPFLSTYNLSRDLTWLSFALPIGISFFLLQSISYLIDIYRGDIEAETSFLDFQLLMSFFPKLAAGPLVKAKDFLAQFKEQGSLTRDMVSSGLVMILLGLIKKLVVADMLDTSLVGPVFANISSYSSIDVVLAIYALAIQLYCDISGYCDIAIGCSLLLGVRISQNFDRPYGAKSLFEFWGRWYKSLTGFFVDYIFRSLGGANCGLLSAGRNLFLTFLMASLWHGTSLSFIIFAVLHTACLSGSYLVARFMPNPTVYGVAYGPDGVGKFVAYGDRGLRLFGPVFSICFTFHIVSLGWVLLMSEDLGVFGDIFSVIAKADMSAELTTPYLVILLVSAFSMHFLPPDFWSRFSRKLSHLNSIYLGMIFGLGVLVVQVLESPVVKPFFYGAF